MTHTGPLLVFVVNETTPHLKLDQAFVNLTV
jgi:hypothetical protein